MEVSGNSKVSKKHFLGLSSLVRSRESDSNLIGYSRLNAGYSLQCSIDGTSLLLTIM